MRRPIRRHGRLMLVGTIAALVIASCGGSTATQAPVTLSPAPSPNASAGTSTAPSLTPVPGGATATPSAGASMTTTDTPWGTIVDSVPADFPVYPGATPTEPVDGPASGAWVVHADPATVSSFYVNALAGAGYSSNDRSGPLEDGSYTVDTRSDVPECRIQTTARPQGDMTLITVLFGAGCVGLGG